MMRRDRGVIGLRIAIEPSRLLTAIVVVAHGFACIAIAVSGISIEWLVPASAVLVAHGASIVYCQALRKARHAVTLVELRDETECALTRKDGVICSGKVLPSTLVLPWCVVLHVAVSGRRFPARVLVLPDSVASMSFRHLRVRLRWARYEGGRTL
jgi:hypothetical protein